MRIHHGVVVLCIALAVLAPRKDRAPHGLVAQAQAQSQAPPQTQALPQAPATAPPNDVSGPVEENSVRLAIIGDTGTGTQSQFDVGAQMARARQRFPFEFVIMLGDNIYGSERPQDFAQKFEKPYATLLTLKVPFYAALGNHDDPTQRYYKPFNMNGERFYTFTKGDARFFALDSNYMDQTQLKWLEDQLKGSNSRWKVAYFHHPLYSSGGRHGSDADLRALVEPLFVKYGMDLVFAGHEHFYERIKPQKGIYYFIAGGSAKLAKGDIRRTALTAAGVDSDYTFMLAELGKTNMQFQVLSRGGKRVDGGILPLAPEPSPPADAQSRTQ
jgi:predicted phosphodiesterase